jgi:hypothetical protein
MLWYGYSRSLFTADFAAELLERSGFAKVQECSYKTTQSEFEQIVDLDNRRDESLFIEARRGPDRPDAQSGPYNPGVADDPSLQIVEMAHSTPNDELHGHYRVEQDDSTLQLVGWVLGVNAQVVGVEVLSGSEVVASASPVVERPDIAEAFPDLPGVDTCGFQLAIEPSGRGRSRLELRATLEDGRQAPLGEIEVMTSPGRRKGLFRRFG